MKGGRLCENKHRDHISPKPSPQSVPHRRAAALTMTLIDVCTDNSVLNSDVLHCLCLHIGLGSQEWDRTH